MKKVKTAGQSAAKTTTPKSSNPFLAKMLDGVPPGYDTEKPVQATLTLTLPLDCWLDVIRCASKHNHTVEQAVSRFIFDSTEDTQNDDFHYPSEISEMRHKQWLAEREEGGAK